MPNIYHNTPLNEKPQITIISYTAEMDDVHSTHWNYIDSRHSRTDDFMDTDILQARKDACDLFLKESKRLKTELDDAGNDDTRRLGLVLYYTVKNNTPAESEESGVERYYLMDDEDVPQSKMLERLNQEYFHLIAAGVEFDSIEVGMGDETYFVALGGLFQISRDNEPL